MCIISCCNGVNFSPFDRASSSHCDYPDCNPVIPLTALLALSFIATATLSFIAKGSSYDLTKYPWMSKVLPSIVLVSTSAFLLTTSVGLIKLFLNEFHPEDDIDQWANAIFKMIAAVVVCSLVIPSIALITINIITSALVLTGRMPFATFGKIQFGIVITISSLAMIIFSSICCWYKR